MQGTSVFGLGGTNFTTCISPILATKFALQRYHLARLRQPQADP